SQDAENTRSSRNLSSRFLEAGVPCTLWDRSVPDMANELGDRRAGWTTPQVYAMAAVCLAVGLGVGYLFRGSAPGPKNAQPVQAMQPAAAPSGDAHAMPTLE